MATTIPRSESAGFLSTGHMKSMVYEAPLTWDMDLVARIGEVAGSVRGSSGHFKRVRESTRRRCDGCIAANGWNFEHLL